jgi:16S rRNA (uracil1498-N3)-methyltransferase
MSSNRFFIIDGNPAKGDVVVLGEGESRHLFKVVRARPGDEVTLLDGNGGIYRSVIRTGGTIGGVRKGSDVTAEITSVERAEPGCPVDIALPIIKSGRMDLAVEKCAEIGVRRIIPIQFGRSIWRGAQREAEKKRERLERKVVAACKQSGNPWFTKIEPVTAFNGLLARLNEYGVVYLADSRGRPFSSVLREREGCRHKSDSQAGKPAMLGISGPEGGLTDTEREALVSAGAVKVSLGLNRLRSETSSFLVASLLILWDKESRA